MADEVEPARAGDSGPVTSDTPATSISVKAGRLVLAVASPTRALASCRKAGLDADATSRIIITSNQRYLAISVVTVAIISVAMFLAGHDLANGPATLPWPIRMMWAWFLWSRATEVLVAFYCDAFDKLLPTIISASALTWSQRVRLALNSYGELVINFALGYALLPVCEWQTKAQPSNIGDILFYSASTITTSGGGGFVPQGLALKFLTIYEVACGLILLVVCFAIYAGRAIDSGERPSEPNAASGQPVVPTRPDK